MGLISSAGSLGCNSRKPSPLRGIKGPNAIVRYSPAADHWLAAPVRYVSDTFAFIATNRIATRKRNDLLKICLILASDFEAIQKVHKCCCFSWFLLMARAMNPRLY